MELLKKSNSDPMVYYCFEGNFYFRFNNDSIY